MDKEKTEYIADKLTELAAEIRSGTAEVLEFERNAGIREIPPQGNSYTYEDSGMRKFVLTVAYPQ